MIVVTLSPALARASPRVASYVLTVSQACVIAPALSQAALHSNFPVKRNFLGSDWIRVKTSQVIDPLDRAAISLYVVDR